MFLRFGAATSAALLVFLSAAAAQPTYTIETIAGKAFTEEGAAPLDSRLNNPFGLAVKPDGSICFSDSDHFRVRCLQNGEVRTIVGTGALGAGGNGGPALEAELVEPRGIAWGPDGSLYIADTIDLVVRRVAPDGTISIFAGTGEGGSEGEDGPATEAELSEPTDVAVDDAGNVYIADPFSDRVLIVGLDGVLARFAGSGETGYSGDGGPATMAELFDPAAIALGPDGEVYIADQTNDVIRRVDAEGIIQTVVGTGQNGSFGDGGSPLQARLDSPGALAVGADGVLYIADGESRLRAVDFEADEINTVAGSGDPAFLEEGLAVDVALPGLRDVTVSSEGRIFLSSTGADRIFELVEGEIRVVAGRSHFGGDGGAALDASLGRVEALNTGSVYVADLGNQRVRKIDEAGIITTIAGNGIPVSSGDGGPALEAGMAPLDVLPEPDGSILVLDGNGFIRRIRADGTIQRLAGNGELELGPPAEGVPAIQSTLGIPLAFDRDAEGNIYLLQNIVIQTFFGFELQAIVRRITPGGTIQTVLGGGTNLNERVLALQAGIISSSGLAVSPEGRICFTDDSLLRVRCLDEDGLVRTVIGPSNSASLTAESLVRQVTPVIPAGLAMGADGELYIADLASMQVLRVETDGSFAPIAGTGEAASSGDGGPALSADLFMPDSLAVDSEGRVLLFERQTWSIRRLTPSEPTVLVSAVANAASFAAGPTAAEAIVSLFGTELADSTEIATEVPLPTTLGGVTVEVVDSEGETRSAPLFFVSAGQINLQIPPGTAPGPATLRVTAPAGVGQLAVTIEASAAGLFSINATGAGLAAAAAIRVAEDGAQSVVEVFDASENPVAPVPIDLGPEGEQVVLLLFGTGVRGASTVEVTMNGEPTQVLGFVPQPDFVGLDQINVIIPRSLIGAGEVTVSVTVDGNLANEVTINVGG